MSDLSFNIVALDKASTTFTKLAEQVDRVAEKLDKLDGENVEAEVNIKANDPIDAAWRSQVQASIKEMSADALKIPVTPETAQYRAQIQTTIAELQSRLKQEIPADLAEADRFRAQVEALAKSTQESIKVRIPVDADTSSAKQKLLELGNVSRSNALAFGVMFAGMPVAAAAAAGATVAALGVVPALFIGIGAAALKNNDEVAGSWSALGTKLKSDAASWASPLAQPFVDSANKIGQAADALSPQIRQAFSNSAQGVGILTDAAVTFAGTAMPGLVTASRSGISILSVLPTVAGQVGAGFTTMMTTLSSSSQATKQDLLIVGGTVQDFEGFVGQLAANLATNGGPALGQFRGILQQVEQALTTLTQNGSSVYSFFQGFGSSVSGLLTIVQGVSSVLASLPAPVMQFGGSLAATTSLARMFGINVGAAFDGLGGKIKSAVSNADSFGSAMAGIGRAVGPAVAVSAALGIVSLGLDVLAQKQQKQAQANAQMVSDQNAFYNALVASNGAIDENIQKLVLQDAVNKQVGSSGDSLLSFITKAAGPDGIALMQRAVEGDKGALAELVKILNSVADSIDPKHLGVFDMANNFRDAASKVDGLATSFDNASIAARASAQANAAAGNGFVSAAAGMQKNLDVANAAGSIHDRLAQAQQQVASSAQAVTNAQHGLAQSGQAVVNAQHGVEQAQIAAANAAHSVETAQRSLDQAYYGVAQAEKSYTQAQQDALTAQNNLNKAREQAIQDLKDLHLQLADQQVSEGQATVNLFDAQQSAAAQGVDLGNAQAIAGQQVTATNEAQIKAALNLLSAQNQLNDSQNAGTKLRQQVAAADAAGVDGSQAVMQAQQQVKSAQDALSQADYALKQAHQGVTDAEYGLQQAHQGVTDAAWGLRQAQQGVTDAQYGQRQAALQLTQAQNGLRTANDAASLSLDMNTAAGRNNLTGILQLWQAIQATGMPVQDQYTALVNQTAAAFGWSTDQAQAYLTKLGLIPPDFQFKTTAVAEADVSALKSVFQGAFAGGKVAGSGWAFAEGGYTGAGGKYEPAGVVHAGEVVWSQQDVARSGGVDAVESARLSGLIRGGDGASLPGYAKGGVVGASQAAGVNLAMTGMGNAYQGAVNTLTAMGFPAPPGLPKYVPPPPTAAGFGAAVPASRSGNRQTVLDTWRQFGWVSPAEIAATDYLLMRESGYNNVAQNPTSTAFGMFQFLNSTWAGYGVPKTADPALQGLAGGRYIAQRYGDPVGAAAHERAFNWYANGGVVTKPLLTMNKPGGYDNGGPLPPGWSQVYNGTGKPENVRTSGQEDALLSELKEIRKVLGKTGNTYNMPIHNARNTETDLQAQMDRMAIRAGIL